MDIKECFDKRLLKKVNPDKLKMRNSLNIAESKFFRAKELFDKEFFEESLISCYTSMFHAARALLYEDEIQEKSHFAVYIYINEKYKEQIPPYLIEAFRVYQSERHAILYGFDSKFNKDYIESAINDAEEFLNKIQGLV